MAEANIGPGRTGPGHRKFSHGTLRLEMPRSNSVPSALNTYEQEDIIDGSVSQVEPEEVKEEGKELFQNFVREEISRQGLPEPEILSPPIHTPQGYQNPVWAKTGREMRLMADAFAKTKEREKIRKKAQRVSMEQLTYDQFQDMLTELFLIGEGGVTRERIMVLFVFCSDVAICFLVRKAMDLFQQLIAWSMRYITERVCAWVTDHGGWENVISRSAEMLNSLVTLLAFAIAAWSVYRWVRGRF